MAGSVVVGSKVICRVRTHAYDIGDIYTVRAFDYTSGGRTALQFEERAGTFLKSNFKIHNNEDRKMAHIPPEGKFYMLVTDKGSPIVSHIDKEEARTEAQRLIRNGVDRVVLLEATEVIKPLTRTETTTLG